MLDQSETSIQQILVTRNPVVILRPLFQEFDNEEEQSESSSSSKSNRPREERRDKEKSKRSDHRGGRGRSSDSDDAAQTHRSVSPSRQAFEMMYIVLYSTADFMPKGHLLYHLF